MGIQKKQHLNKLPRLAGIFIRATIIGSTNKCRDRYPRQHRIGNQGNRANQNSDNYKGAGAPFSQKDNRAHQGSDNIKKTSPTLKWVKNE